MGMEQSVIDTANQESKPTTFEDGDDLYTSRWNDTGIQPTGFRILVSIPEKDEKTKSGLFIPQEAKKQEEIASVVARVLQLGPLAYQDESKFGEGSDPWCLPGDYVVMAAYSGTRLKLAGCSHEYRLINDDSVVAVVPDADSVERA